MLKRIASTIISDEEEKILLQLRDDIPQIGHPDHWGLFGGKMENDETPEAAAIRELKEELGIAVDVQRFHFFGEYSEHPNKTHFVFRYRARDELKWATLMEGQRMGYFASDDIRLIENGLLEEHPIIPIVATMLRDHFNDLSKYHS